MSIVCAANTLDRRGGGVAAASRLMWRAMQERWGDHARLVTLLDDTRPGALLSPGSMARLRFGMRLTEVQAPRDCRGVLCAHLSTGVAESYVPSPLRKPYAVFLHGVEVWRELDARQRRTLSGAARLLSNSAFTARRVAEWHPWIGPVADCGLALPIAEPQPSTSRAAVPMGPHAVVIVGRMDAAEQYKGHDQLIQAWPAVKQRVQDAQLIVVGTGDDQTRLAAKAAAVGVGDSVVFTGFVPDEALASVYARAALLAMPSRNEGFGLVYLEAMAHRLPCIGSTHDAASEVIADGVSGYLIDQSDIGRLSEHLVRLLSDESLRVAMGAEGRRRLDERFSYERFSRRLLSLLDETFGAAQPTAA